MRPGKGARSNACNLKFDSDFAKGLFDYRGCSSLVTNFRKNDQERKGHWMRFGKSADPDLNLDPRISSGCSQATPRTVPLAAMCGSQTRTASMTPGTPSAASRIRPGAAPGSSPLPPPPPGGRGPGGHLRRPSRAYLIITNSALYFAPHPVRLGKS